MINRLDELLANPNLPIVVSLPENKLELAEAAIEAGADALKFHIHVNHRASGNVFHGLEEYRDVFTAVREKFDGPIGIVIGDEINKVNEVDLQALKEVGFDYYSLYAKHVTSKLLLQDQLAQTVAVDDQFDPTHAKALEVLNLKALEISIVKGENYGSPLHLEDIVAYINYRKNTDLPLIVPSQKKLVSSDLKVLRDIGMNAVMVGAVTIGKTKESIYQTISEFKAYLANLN
ncbi:hypothetical protein [Ornithinibacillus halotolerans]|uniref:Uncharacterized protein n=1 Tax=Ornithinibacillus halotolerans TaxID=1274357 RepID=A0A916WF03_9BACI|nr:hypothetical protein [Ornithinibacillus halotolerans]GGA92018.1 hypothetical protein GCM10008025_38080 [Ornithinibacillus halotolerans]